MMGLGLGEILLIVIVALVVFGPARLPELGRTVGRCMRKFRQGMRELEESWEKVAAEPEERADYSGGTDAEEFPVEQGEDDGTK